MSLGADVTLVSPSLAALSTDFSGGGARFGTQMATIDGGSVSFGANFRVEDSLGFNLALGPANFPLVNAAFQGRYLYTANGAMQVQDLQTNTIAVLDNDFVEAVTVAVNEARAVAVFGVGGVIPGSGLLVYDLRSDPMNPTIINPEGPEFDVDGRITSVASGGDVAPYR